MQLTRLVIEPVGNGDVARVPDRTLRSRVLVCRQLRLRLHDVLVISGSSSVHVRILVLILSLHSYEFLSPGLRFLLQTDLFLSCAILSLQWKRKQIRTVPCPHSPLSWSRLPMPQIVLSTCPISHSYFITVQLSIHGNIVSFGCRRCCGRHHIHLHKIRIK